MTREGGRAERKHEALIEVKERNKEDLLAREGVLGVGVGKAELVVFAKRGVPVEGEIEGQPVRIIRTDDFSFLLTGSDRRSKWRPCPPGTEIAVEGGLGPGTFGAVVLKNGEKKILSNNHVLAAFGNVAIGSLVYQPPDSSSVLAKLESFAPLSTSTPNKVDCALANPLSQADIIPNILVKDDSLDGSIIPTGVKKAYVHQKVVKSGAGSGYTEGEVLSTDSTIGVKEYTYEEVIITERLASKGDSGSLVMDKGTHEAIGLIFAGSKATTAVCDMQSVLDALGCTLYTGKMNKTVTFHSVPSGASVKVVRE